MKNPWLLTNHPLIEKEFEVFQDTKILQNVLQNIDAYSHYDILKRIFIGYCSQKFLPAGIEYGLEKTFRYLDKDFDGLLNKND